MRPKLGSLLMAAAMFGAANDHNVNENYTPRKRESVPSWKKKKCKSCDLFSKSTHNCSGSNWKRHITVKSTACSDYKHKKK